MNFLLNKTFNELDYDVIFNINLDDIYNEKNVSENIEDLVLGQFIMLEQIITGKTKLPNHLVDLEIAKLIIRPKSDMIFDNENHSKEYNNMESFLIRSTRNLCLDRIKHNNVVLKNSKILKVLNNNSVEPQGEKKEVSEIIKSIINELPKKQKMIIHLRDVEGYEFDEIYKATGIEQNAIRVNLSRARKTVKQELLKTMNYGL